MSIGNMVRKGFDKFDLGDLLIAAGLRLPHPKKVDADLKEKCGELYEAVKAYDLEGSGIEVEYPTGEKYGPI